MKNKREGQRFSCMAILEPTEKQEQSYSEQVVTEKKKKI